MSRKFELPNWALTVIVTIVLLAAAEIGFRWNGKYIGFMERYGEPYAPLYSKGAKTWYYVYGPHSTRRDYSVNDDHSTEFSNYFVANNEGLLDKEFREHGDDDTIRIMAIGDSFIQGIGAPADSSCPRLLEKILNDRYKGKPAIQVWDCGMGGSDPYYEYMLLANRLLKYKPDYVIEAINNTDITDIVLRGSMGRFQPDSTVAFVRQSRIEKYYAHSYLVRRIVHDVLRYNWMLISDEELANAKAVSIRQIDSAMVDFKQLCDSRHIPLLISVQAMKEDFQEGAPNQMREVLRFCDSMHFHTVDVQRCMEKEGYTGEKVKPLYWSVDMHFKPIGYAHYAQYLSAPLIPYIDSIKEARHLRDQ